MTVTDQQARALAFLAAAARPTGARRWDEAGILANIKKVADRSLASVTIAVMQAAEDRNAHTPGIIATSGPHWRNPESAPTPDREPFDEKAICRSCYKPRSICDQDDGHPFVSLAQRPALVAAPMPDDIKAAIAEGPRTWPARDLTQAAAPAAAADTEREEA